VFPENTQEERSRPLHFDRMKNNFQTVLG
jgi:hypothetical protein